MTLSAKYQYYKRIKDRYRKASKSKKQLILDEFCEVCGYNRKYAIRLLNPQKRRGPKPKRNNHHRSVYKNDAEFLEALERIWKLSRKKCGKILKESIKLYLPFYRQKYILSKEVECKLLKVSSSTIDRLLKPKKLKSGKSKSLTKPGSIVRSQIPIRCDYWRETEPGFVEADTVSHCGMSTKGPFIITLTLTDNIEPTPVYWTLL